MVLDGVVRRIGHAGEGLPGATILQVSAGWLHAAAWDDLGHVRLTRSFLDDPAGMIRRLRN